MLQITGYVIIDNAVDSKATRVEIVFIDKPIGSPLSRLQIRVEE